MKTEYIVVGLGNPDRKYENTRHNAGFIMIDFIADKIGVKINRVKFKSLVGEGNIGNSKVLLMKPSTYMNNSGEAVIEAMKFYKIPPENVIVLLDDINLEAGLLMFGYEYEITSRFPQYFLDYQEDRVMIGVTRWKDRITSTSGDWSGNQV